MSARNSAARPKRAGETFARSHHGHDEGPSSKKPRFDIRNPSALAPDAPEEDAVLELDEIGKGGQATKRGAVNLDGYGSDSSNEGFDARAERKADAAKKAGKNEGPSEQEEQNDMFADLEEEHEDGDEDEELSREGKKKNKDVRFLEEDDIDGQEDESKGGGHVAVDFSANGASSRKGKGKARAYDSGSESDEEEGDEGVKNEEVDEEVGAGGKKTHAPKLSAFNMREELDEGRFDTEGNFVRKAADPDAVHDTWLEGISKKDQRRAREAEEKRAEEQRQRTLADDQVLTSDALGTLITRLDRGETVLEALARLGKGMEKKKPKWQMKKKGQKRDRNKSDGDDDNGDGNMDVDNGSEQVTPEQKQQQHQREQVDAVTGAADLLLTRGQVNIYEDTREALTRQFRRETGDEWVEPARAPTTSLLPPSASSNPTIETSKTPSNGNASGSPGKAQWEYRWVDARDGGEVHGPYDGATMVAWRDAGFFQDGVEFRRIDSAERGWSRSVDFV